MNGRIATADGADEAADLLGWTITNINGQDVADRTGQQILQVLSRFKGQEVTLGLSQGDEQRSKTLIYGGNAAHGPDAMAAEALGLPIQVVKVTEGAARQAGMIAGDVIHAVDEVAITSQANLIAELARGGETERQVQSSGGKTKCLATDHHGHDAALQS